MHAAAGVTGEGLTPMRTGMGPELDLRPQLERLDRLIFWSKGIEEGVLALAPSRAFLGAKARSAPRLP